MVERLAKGVASLALVPALLTMTVIVCPDDDTTLCVIVVHSDDINMATIKGRLGFPNLDEFRSTI